MASFWVAFGMPFGSLLVAFGFLWASPWAPLALFCTSGTPFRAFSTPWTDFGGVFLSLGRFRASFWVPLAAFGSLGTLVGSPWPSFCASNFQIHRLVLARLSPDECWLIPAEFKRILRNRFVIIGLYRHLIFSKVSNSRLPQ